MSEITEYDLIMKMLEIIESRQRSSLHSPNASEKEQIINVIERIEGNLVLTQETREEVITMEGDRFEGISSSVIATRGSSASGNIEVGENSGEVEKALKQIEQLIQQADPKLMPTAEKEKAFKLLEELNKQASSPNKIKAVLEALGNGLWDLIKNVEPLVKAAPTLWPIVEKLWK